MTSSIRVIAAAAAIAVASAAGAAQAQSDLLDSRIAVANVFEQLQCIATDGELREGAAAAGLSDQQLKEALKFMRQEGTIDSRKEQGVFLIRMLGTNGCPGPLEPPMRNPLNEKPVPDATSQRAFTAITEHLRANGCVSTRDELIDAAVRSGASEGAGLNALIVMGGSGQLRTIRDGSAQGVRLSGAPGCP